MTSDPSHQPVLSRRRPRCDIGNASHRSGAASLHPPVPRMLPHRVILYHRLSPAPTITGCSGPLHDVHRVGGCSFCVARLVSPPRIARACVHLSQCCQPPRFYHALPFPCLHPASPQDIHFSTMLLTRLLTHRFDGLDEQWSVSVPASFLGMLHASPLTRALADGSSSRSLPIKVAAFIFCSSNVKLEFKLR